MLDLTRRTLAVITGASRGIGQTIAVELTKRLSDINTGSSNVVILVARSTDKLKATQKICQEICNSATVTIETITLDLADLHFHQLEAILQQYCGCGGGWPTPENAIIFHNAGTVGRIANVLSVDSVADWRHYFDVNVNSVVMLNAMCVRTLPTSATSWTMVNVTSLCGRRPFHQLAQYGAGKAARELIFKVLALENPNITVLNYSPGPVRTDMLAEVINNSTEFRRQLSDPNSILTAEVTVEKLMKLLISGQFESGATIDYYDN